MFSVIRVKIVNKKQKQKKNLNTRHEEGHPPEAKVIAFTLSNLVVWFFLIILDSYIKWHDPLAIQPWQGYEYLPTEWNPKLNWNWFPLKLYISFADLSATV